MSFLATNNKVEYEALIYGLELAKHLRIRLLKIRSDSKLIVEQVAGRFKPKKPRMKAAQPMTLKPEKGSVFTSRASWSRSNRHRRFSYSSSVSFLFLLRSMAYMLHHLRSAPTFPPAENQFPAVMPCPRKPNRDPLPSAGR